MSRPSRWFSESNYFPHTERFLQKLTDAGVRDESIKMYKGTIYYRHKEKIGI
jgi:hypothetical protein